MKKLKDFFYWLENTAPNNIQNFFLTGFLVAFVIAVVALLFLIAVLWEAVAIPFFLICFGVPIYEYMRYKNDKL